MTTTIATLCLTAFAWLLLNEIQAAIDRRNAKRYAMNRIAHHIEPPPPDPDDINVLALVRGTERYVFLYDDESRAETLRVLGRYASRPDLSFTWYDAALLSQKVRDTPLTRKEPNL